MDAPWPLLRDLSLALAIQGLACLALFPLAARPPVLVVDAERVQRRADAPAEREPDAPPRAAGLTLTASGPPMARP